MKKEPPGPRSLREFVSPHPCKCPPEVLEQKLTQMVTFPSVSDTPHRHFRSIRCARCASISHIDILSHAGWFYCLQCGKRFYSWQPNDPEANRATEELLEKWLDPEHNDE